MPILPNSDPKFDMTGLFNDWRTIFSLRHQTPPAIPPLLSAARLRHADGVGGAWRVYGGHLGVELRPLSHQRRARRAAGLQKCAGEYFMPFH